LSTLATLKNWEGGLLFFPFVFNWRERRDIEGTLWVIQRHKLSASAKSELNKWRRIFFWNIRIVWGVDGSAAILQQ
jgi:hypothetical protein